MLVRSSHIIDLFSMVVLWVVGLKAYMGTLPSIDYSRYLVPFHKVDPLSLLSVKLTYVPLDCRLTAND